MTDMPHHVVLPANDPGVRARLADGWVVDAESWGARLAYTAALDPALRALVERAERSGVAITELDADAADDVWRLQEATRSDFPVTPATPAPDASRDEIAVLWSSGWRVFGARRGAELIGATLIRAAAPPARPAYAETEWTAVVAAHRGRGVAQALKAASVLALGATGTRLFATGGAGTNAASLGMNAAIGYRVTERWFTLVRPPG